MREGEFVRRRESEHFGLSVRCGNENERPVGLTRNTVVNDNGDDVVSRGQCGGVVEKPVARARLQVASVDEELDGKLTRASRVQRGVNVEIETILALRAIVGVCEVE